MHCNHHRRRRLHPASMLPSLSLSTLGPEHRTALSAEKNIQIKPTHCSGLNGVHIEHNQNHCEGEVDVRNSCTRDESPTLSHHLWHIWVTQWTIVRHTLCFGNWIANCFCGTDILPHQRGHGCLTRQDVGENASLSSNIEASEPMTYIYFHAVGGLIINAREDWP